MAYLDCLNPLQEFISQGMTEGYGFESNDDMIFSDFIYLSEIDYKRAMHPDKISSRQFIFHNFEGGREQVFFVFCENTTVVALGFDV